MSEDTCAYCLQEHPAHLEKCPTRKWLREDTSFVCDICGAGIDGFGNCQGLESVDKESFRLHQEAETR